MLMRYVAWVSAFAALSVPAAVAAQDAVLPVKPARVITQSCPWPDIAAQGSPAWEQTVELRFQIAATAEVMDVTALAPTGDADFDTRLITAARQCRVEAATRGDAAVESWHRLAFTLRDPNGPTQPPWPPGVVGRSCVFPDYPQESVRLEEQGRTRLRLTVTDDGRLRGAEIESSSGSPRLDAAALAAFSKCRLRAGRTAENKPVGGAFVVEFVWRLEPNAGVGQP